MKIFKRIILIVFALLMLISPTTVHAEYNGGEGVSGVDVSGKLTGGPQHRK